MLQVSDQQYRVFGAMLALGEFTVEDLAKLSGVKADTVRTTLGRNKEWVEELGKIDPSGPGGRMVRYRTQPGRIHALRAKLSDLASAMQLEKGLAARAAGVPLELLAAEATLVERLPRVDGAERSALVDLVRTDLHTAQRNIDQRLVSMNAENVELHRRTVESILGLIDAQAGARGDETRVVGSEDVIREASEILARWQAEPPGSYRDAVVRQLEHWRAAAAQRLREAHPHVVVIDGSTGAEGRALTGLVGRLLRIALGTQPDAQPLWAHAGSFRSIDAVLARAGDEGEEPDVFVITVPASRAAGAADFVAKLALRVPGESLFVISDEQEPTLLNNTLHARGTYLLSPGLDPRALGVKLRQSVEARLHGWPTTEHSRSTEDAWLEGEIEVLESDPIELRAPPARDAPQAG